MTQAGTSGVKKRLIFTRSSHISRDIKLYITLTSFLCRYLDIYIYRTKDGINNRFKKKSAAKPSPLRKPISPDPAMRLIGRSGLLGSKGRVGKIRVSGSLRSTSVCIVLSCDGGRILHFYNSKHLTVRA